MMSIHVSQPFLFSFGTFRVLSVLQFTCLEIIGSPVDGTSSGMASNPDM
jgi:hypothetical protein